MPQREQASLRGSGTPEEKRQSCVAKGSSIPQGTGHPSCLCLEENRHLWEHGASLKGIGSLAARALGGTGSSEVTQLLREEQTPLRGTSTPGCRCFGRNWVL